MKNEDCPDFSCQPKRISLNLISKGSQLKSYGELTRKPTGSLSSPAHYFANNLQINIYLNHIKNVEIKCKHAHELSKTLLLLSRILIFFNLITTNTSEPFAVKGLSVTVDILQLTSFELEIFKNIDAH